MHPKPSLIDICKVLQNRVGQGVHIINVPRGVQETVQNKSRHITIIAHPPGLSLMLTWLVKWFGSMHPMTGYMMH